MPNVEVITVATHSEGNYENLIHNNYNVNIKTLGFGEKWNGLIMKYELVYQYIQNKKDDDIIIFLDGFDTVICNDYSSVIDYFISQDKKVIYSVDNVPSGIKKYLYNRVFFKEGNDVSINSGMYIGYVKYLKIILKDILKKGFKSDQKATVQIYQTYDFIGTDKDEVMFKNKIMQTKMNTSKNDPPFVSFPGFIYPNRLYRCVFEYSQYFLDIYIGIFIVLSSIILYYKRYMFFILLGGLYLFIFYNMDKSGIKNKHLN